MEKLEAFKYELQPNRQQELDVRPTEGACCFLFNKALFWQKENYGAGNKFINYVSMSKALTSWRNDPATPWLKAAPYHSLQHSLKDLEKA